MVASAAAKIARAPGRVVINPTIEPSTGTFPFGGKQIGKVNQARFTRTSAPIPIFHEGSGEIGDVLEGPNRYSFSCFLRGWDDDAISAMFGTQASVGADSGHTVVLLPSLISPGKSAFARGLKVLYVPDDALNIPALLIYNAIPDMAEGADMMFQRGAELGVSMSFECTRDSYGRVAAIGRIGDLRLVPSA